MRWLFKPPRSHCYATLFPKYTTTRGDEISNKLYFPEDGASGKSALGSNPGKLMFCIAQIRLATTIYLEWWTILTKTTLLRIWLKWWSSTSLLFLYLGEKLSPVCGYSEATTLEGCVDHPLTQLFVGREERHQLSPTRLYGSMALSKHALWLMDEDSGGVIISTDEKIINDNDQVFANFILFSSPRWPRSPRFFLLIYLRRIKERLFLGVMRDVNTRS